MSWQVQLHGPHGLEFSDTALHLGHVLHCTLDDSDDIKRATLEMCKKANILLLTFPHCAPDVKTVLFQSHCLSLYHGAALWNIKYKQLKSLEIAFNNILRRIWWLPRKCHTSILHSVARLDSIYNRTVRLSDRLNSNACNSKHLLIRDTFSASSRLAYTPSGSNHLSDHSNYIKKYLEQDDIICADHVRYLRLNCYRTSDSEDMIH